jgi:hypothetical protein
MQLYAILDSSGRTTLEVHDSVTDPFDVEDDAAASDGSEVVELVTGRARPEPAAAA